jgi:hypothetical protein
MIRYRAANQLSIEEFQTPFELHLDKGNRWVKLASIIPWDELAGIYYQCMSAAQGAPSLDARIVIGAMIIKHKLKLDDREVVETIRENLYLQYFLGLSSYTAEPLFDRSLFTAFRYRLGQDKFDQMNQRIIAKALDISPVQIKEKDTPAGNSDNTDKGRTENPADEPLKSDEQPKGKLKIDATVADQMIKYPTDLDLLSDSRQESERLIDQLVEHLNLSKKPRTYRRNARRDYLKMAKKKKKNKRELHKAIGKQLNYLKRNLGTIDKLLDNSACAGIPFSKRDYKIYLVIQHIYAQQLQMHLDKSHSHADRIVNIYQPHVRAIVRGKAKASRMVMSASIP